MSAAPKLQAGEVFLNPAARTAAVTAPSRAPLGLHRRLPGYAVTPLADAPALAMANGVGRVWVKDESSRLGLPAFKLLGASWAAYRALAARLGRDPEPWVSLDELRQTLAPLRPLTLATATDGNHGRAVARIAALLDLDADVYVPKGTAAARIAAIEREGARVTVVDGDYDRAVASAAATAGDRCLAIQDVGWPGYEQVPAWVVEGYGTIFWRSTTSSPPAVRRRRTWSSSRSAWAGSRPPPCGTGTGGGSGGRPACWASSRSRPPACYGRCRSAGSSPSPAPTTRSWPG